MTIKLELTPEQAQCVILALDLSIMYAENNIEDAIASPSTDRLVRTLRIEDNDRRRKRFNKTLNELRGMIQSPKKEETYGYQKTDGIEMG